MYEINALLDSLSRDTRIEAAVARACAMIARELARMNNIRVAEIDRAEAAAERAEIIDLYKIE